jgi:hypothetical protein
LERLADVTREAKESIRTYVSGVKAASQGGPDFAPYLRRYLENFSRDYGIATVLTIAPGMEGVRFDVAGSLTIRGGAREDTVTISESLHIAGADLIIEAETISVAAGSSINTGSADVTSTAIAEADGLSDTIAAVTIQGQITTETIELKARRLSSYSATGRSAYNNISGGVKAYVDGRTVAAGAGGFTIAAVDKAVLTAESPELEVDLDILSSVTAISVAAARNSLNGNTEAYINDSTITATNGSIDVTAERDAKISSIAAATSLVADDGFPTALSLTLGGTFTENVLLGDVKAYADSSTLTTTGSGAVSLTARDSSAIDATSQLSAVAKTDPLLWDIGGSAGVSIAFNSIGWNPNSMALPDLTIPLEITNALLGINFGTEETPDVEAYLLDNTNVSAAGDVSVPADSAAAAMVNATGKAVGGVLASSKVSSTAEASIDVRTQDYTSADGSKSILPGTRVLVAESYANGGTPGVVYEHIVGNLIDDVLGLLDLGGDVADLLGPGALTAGSLDLGAQDYADTDYWKPLTFPTGIGEVDATGDVTVSALYNAGVYAKVKLTTSSVSTNDGGMWGALSVSANSDAAITASVENSSMSIALAPDSDATTVAVGAVLSLNKIAASTVAAIDALAKVEAEGNISIQATDSTAIIGDVSAVSLGVSASPDNATAVSVALAWGSTR